MDVELKNKQVKPRKRHRCAWCGEWCEVGQPAQYRAYIFEGGFNSDYMHTVCYTAMSKSDLGSDGFQCGEFKRGQTAMECEDGYGDYLMECRRDGELEERRMQE